MKQHKYGRLPKVVSPDGDASHNDLVSGGHICTNIYTQDLSKNTHISMLGESSNKGQLRDEEGDY